MLPTGFEFSQSSLQDFVDCKRRFQLKYVEQRVWPAVEVEPFLQRESLSVKGKQFHQMVERFYAGVPVDLLETTLRDEDIRQWWAAFCNEPPLNLPKSLLLPEYRLTTTVAEHRLVGVFDLLAVDPGKRAVVVDWKTGRYRPGRDIVELQLQTLIYPYLFVESGAQVFGAVVDPARLMMVYWYANMPEQPHVFHYDVVAHQRVGEYLSKLFEEIFSLNQEVVWQLVDDETVCKYCAFRSLCDRGVVAGEVGEFDDLLLVGLDDMVGLDY